MACSFYGFPAHYYREKYPHQGSREIATSVASALQAGGIKVKPVSRDIDHGVWVCFKVGKLQQQAPDIYVSVCIYVCFSRGGGLFAIPTLLHIV